MIKPSIYDESMFFYLLLISTTLLFYAILLLIRYRREIERKSNELAIANEQMQLEISERIRAEERYALAARGANDGLWDWNLKTNKIYFSSRWKSMIGFRDDELGDSINEWFNRVYPDDIQKFKKDITDHLNGRIPHFENEHRLLNKYGDYLWVLSRGLAVKNDEGIYARMAGSLTDITGHKQAEEKLIQNAFYDTLTGLPNRALFIDRLQMSFAHRKRHKDYLFAVLFLDLDRFKNINDSFGHIIGDELLILVGERLKSLVRPDDTIARFGGDEFVMLIEDIKEVGDATQIAERINRELVEPFHLKHHKLYINVTIGITVSNPEYQQPEEILRDADTAMYNAKLRGKACYLIFDKNMHINAMELLELEIDLRHALERKEFLVYYQPIISLESRDIIGFEALVRWNHPKRGILLPMEFIPLAEETGLIVSLSLWIISEACQQILIWQEQFPSDSPLIMSVNVSAKHLAHKDFISQIKNILKETGVDPNHLAFEITENNILENSEYIVSLMSQLRALNIKINIDDFGTGYSSLSYLSQLPIHTLKIDKSFIDRISRNGNDAEIVQSIINMAHNMKINVVAEGVEKAEQMRKLEGLQCQYAQGFFFSYPVNSNEAEKLLANKNIHDNKLITKR
ncbi:MAG: EAL domain-containing protein [Nitrospirae bacterium]|jgi:diguanylate cyclase (GGDEF)-like protein/PAS domain S-box-containing protein|nr:EAL domain-containing protein [Nitrospirota bacterium]